MAAHGRSAVAAILVAGGSGQRLGANVPKAFVQVGGCTLLEHACRRFTDHPAIDVVVVVAPAGHLDRAAQLTGVPVVAGGAERQHSVAAGLGALPPETEFVLVHDVARPFVPDAVIDAVVAALNDGADAVIPVVPIHDTVRRLGEDGALDGVVDRARLAAVQTPQGFRREILAAAHDRADAIATDDAALVEALGYRVIAVAGDDRAFKITAPLDLAYAETLAGNPVQPSSPGGGS